MRQIQDANEVANLHLLKLQDSLMGEDKKHADQAVSEVSQSLARVRDFESVYNVVEGTYKTEQKDFSVNLVFNNLDTMLKTDFEKRSLTVSFVVDPSVPQNVTGSRDAFTQVVMNLVAGATAGVVRTNVQVVAKQVNGVVCVEVINSRNELTKQQMRVITDVCDSNEPHEILDAPVVDLSTKVAILVAQKCGWSVTFFTEGSTAKFELKADLKQGASGASHDIMSDAQLKK